LETGTAGANLDAGADQPGFVARYGLGAGDDSPTRSPPGLEHRHWFRSRGLFTGPGVVEAGCKAVIGPRVKRSGMRWTIAGDAVHRTTRQEQPDQPNRLNDLDQLQN
jgi:hypothetical protein